MPNRRTLLKYREAPWFWLFVSPWIVGFLVFQAGPLMWSMVMSFNEWDIFNSPKFLGLDNYRKLFTKDPVFIKSIGNTVFFSVVSIGLGMAFSLFISYLLSRPLRGITVYRILIYLPSVIPVVAIATLFRKVLAPNGLLNQFLGWFSISGPAWLLDPDTVLWALAIMSLWGVGSGTILLLAGMKGIPDALYEAARIDGANRMQSYFRITLPMLSPVIFFNLIMGIIAGLQTFSQVYVLTQGKGEPDNASMMMVLYLYNNAFKYFKMGYASSMAWILFVMIMLLTLLVFRSSSMWVFYESEVKK